MMMIFMTTTKTTTSLLSSCSSSVALLQGYRAATASSLAGSRLSLFRCSLSRISSADSISRCSDNSTLCGAVTQTRRRRRPLTTTPVLLTSFHTFTHQQQPSSYTTPQFDFHHQTAYKNWLLQLQNRNFSNMSQQQKTKAILLGVFENPDAKDAYILTPTAASVNTATGGLIEKNINIVGPLKKGKVRIFYGLTPELPVVAVVGLGNQNAAYNDLEEVEEKNENIRSAIASGVRSLRDLGSVDEVDVDGCQNVTAAAEGAALSLYYFDELKSASLKKPQVKVNLLSNESSDENKWNIGITLANGQNLCRNLMEKPANLMTPTIFSKVAEDVLDKLGVNVIVHDQSWAESMKMGSYLSVAKGSDEPPKFVEMHYNNAPNTKPVVFVGKGITFDSGGISLKPSSNMDKMRGDMGGAANVLSTIFTLASKKAPVNIIGLTPLCENLPSGKANKPGDVVTAMNNKTIQVDNTDAEGRLILADALCYAHKFDPLLILDIATLTGAMNVALGSAATGVFTTSTKYWNVMHKAGIETGDRVWRMPLFNHFTKQTTDGQLADLVNIGKYPGQGGCCIAAAFLREFVTHENWLHLDIAGVMDNKDEVSYLCKGMSGRPVRTLVKFVEQIYNEKVF